MISRDPLLSLLCVYVHLVERALPLSSSLSHHSYLVMSTVACRKKNTCKCAVLTIPENCIVFVAVGVVYTFVAAWRGATIGEVAR